jgi:hypothetical protein
MIEAKFNRIPRSVSEWQETIRAVIYKDWW